MPQDIRPIRIEGQLAYVTLTKGYVAVVDTADVGMVSAWNWTAALSKGGYVYAVRNRKQKGKSFHVKMHRLLMGDPVGMLVDHRNQNTLDNRRDNLRIATKAENQRNAKRNTKNTSGYKGVQWSKQREKWKATIVVERKQKHLGFFDDILAARDAYAEGSLKYHGDFGRADNPSTDAAVEALKALADNPKRKVKEAMR